MDAITLVTGVRMMMEDLAEPLAAFRRRHANPILLRQGNDRRAEQLIRADFGKGHLQPRLVWGRWVCL